MAEGTVHIGAQEQFYLEPHVAVCEPHENDEMTVHTCTQVSAIINITLLDHMWLFVHGAADMPLSRCQATPKSRLTGHL